MPQAHLERVLVTGATGTLGYNIVQHLGAAHPETRVHVQMRTLDETLFAGLDNVTLERVDMADFAAMTRSVADFAPNAIIHCAASGVRPSTIGWFEQINLNVLLYEANPLAFIAEQAGGKASSGTGRCRVAAVGGGRPDGRCRPPRPSVGGGRVRPRRDHATGRPEGRPVPPGRPPHASQARRRPPAAGRAGNRPPDDGRGKAGPSPAAAQTGDVAGRRRPQGRRSRSSILSVLLRDRADRLGRRGVRFIDDPLYHGPAADAAVAAVLAQEPLGVEPGPGELRVPRDLPAYFRELYRVPLLSPPRERALFLAFNFHKSRFVAARRRLDLELAGRRDLDRLDACLGAATAFKNDILRANLRLVVSVARRHVRPGVTLMELVSEGNLTLMRAVDGFDLHKGNRFSTYATLALMKGFAQTVPLMQQAARRTGDGSADLSAVADARGLLAADRHAHRDQVSHLLARLDDREQTVLRARFGLSAETADQLADRLGITPRRVRHIERLALTKLRVAAGVECRERRRSDD